ncbi:androgen-induced gene 1 protein-like isoform X1 [Portunus trituberculatus]|uniref:androgen-induced gene 1 protein-like isoform X1 n=1 Tax=Portunus trituberculatus TaxID=210409 RepID=UPI001E1D09A4|nr:androgen-induced gene 1 protein-like isoform X1 [Portunus trituberculatus]XP_045118468.1 androgen-induced gene 1 protein-like isoform X1 [Portunus trituberculatus]XP_045118470.1 androgen-induced gene 1 protein-like isoform X1 [Portunus trituberculatus]XP_045118471.1 androgen-induced gene 1 protein-like isoform X1 [Portunus trituberculatus]XP_045118472.1 androgen-induced gene 1 protein-like isoform X1 [Portunus trituberculatus]XP_045118473.1 androgen-induced gene 1 protein-like isoform X1 [P
MGALPKGYHALTFFVYAFGLYFDHYKLIIPASSNSYRLTHQIIGGRWKYLTYIDLVLQCSFFGLCVLNDLLGSETVVANKRSFLQKLRDFVLTTLVVPLGVFIPLIFWGLYAVDRDLIFPVSMDAWFPSWLNHLMHTLPLIASLLEVVFVNHVYPRGRILYIPIIVASALYVSWLCFIAYYGGFWVYPVFEVLDFKSRAVFMACLVPPNLFFVFLGQKLHTAIWGSGKSSSRRRGKKDKSQ